MKGIRKNIHRGIELFLPLAAVLLGMLVMALQKPLVLQAGSTVPMPQSFRGEYSYDRVNWQPLEADSDLSARNPEIYLRGHFTQDIPEQARLYYFSEHIGTEIFLNGELFFTDNVMELEQYRIPLQPAVCSREWNFYYFDEGVPADVPVEIHLKNYHSFGNKNAYRDYLDTLHCTPNEDEFMAKNLESASQPYNVVGIIFVFAGVLLLCSAAVSFFLRFPVEIAIIQTGLLAVFAGGCFLMDTVDLNFRSENHILNTCGWQICVMYSVYLLGIMTRDSLSGKRKQAAVCVTAVSAAVDTGMILLALTGRVLMYDTLGFWVMLQWICCPVLVFCCAGELIGGNRKKTIDLAVFLLIFVCVLLDCMGVRDSIYSRTPITKAALILVFLLKGIQFIRIMIRNFSASIRANTLEKELEESRIALMISQIQPHFIFNVLGTIRGLCREDPEQAWHALGDFSSYLRGNMNALSNKKSVPFREELAHVETYLRLEQMRMGERLNVVYEIREKDFSIPPLILQPLVENAVKHGLFYKAEGGTVVIRSLREDRRILLAVEDDGIGFVKAEQEADFEQHAHHGLESVRSRVEKMLGGTLRIESDPDHGSKVTLEFPADTHW